VQLRRALNHVAAQLEAVDHEFERFLEERERLAMEGPEGYERGLDLGVLRVTLNRLLPPVLPQAAPTGLNNQPGRTFWPRT